MSGISLKGKIHRETLHRCLPVLLIVAAGVFYCCRWDLGKREDGESRHYIVSTLTLLKGGRISATKRDFQEAERIFGKFRRQNFVPYAYSAKTFLHRAATRMAGKKDFIGRSYYWGTYSALCIPAYVLCRALHIFDANPYNIFKLANILMLLTPLVAAAFVLKGSRRFKYMTLAAFMFPAAAQYINWASAECCIYMFVALTLIFLHNRQYYRSSLCLALAATLNYCLFPLALVVFFWFLRDNREGFSFKPLRLRKDFAKKLLLFGCCFLPVFHAVFSTYLQYGTVAVMSDMGTSHYLWERFFTYLFDLNMGMIVYQPLFFILFLLSLPLILKRRDWELLALWLSLFGMVFCYSFMSHINCGMEGISRYGAWSVPVAVFAVVCVCERHVKSRVADFLIGSAALINALLLAIPIYHNHTTMNSLACFVMDRCPSLYNPLDVIFTDRVSQKMPHGPVYYQRKHCGKVLCRRADLADFWEWFAPQDRGTFEQVERQRKRFLDKSPVPDFVYIDLDSGQRLFRKKYFWGTDVPYFFRGADVPRILRTNVKRKAGENTILLGYKDSQFGPCAPLPPGRYRIVVRGNNLHVQKLRYFCRANRDNKQPIKIEKLKKTPVSAEYEVEIPASCKEVEFGVRNYSDVICRIESITAFPLSRPGIPKK